jgi:tRNA(Leu) C34 or U34 (ribose-2'-O)-methylase TrmL
MGATFTIPIIHMDHWEDCYRELLHVGCTSDTIYAATMLDSDEVTVATKKNPPPPFDVAQEMKNMTKYTNVHPSTNSDSSSGSSTTTATTSKKSKSSITKSTAHYDVDWIGASYFRPNEELGTDRTTLDTIPNTPKEETAGTEPTMESDTSPPPPRRPTASALIIGSEGNGLTKYIRRAIKKGQIQTVYVPMMMMMTTTTTTTMTPTLDPDPPSMTVTPIVESLNAAVCGSIILFEYLRQKQTHPLFISLHS